MTSAVTYFVSSRFAKENGETTLLYNKYINRCTKKKIVSSNI